MKDAILSTSGLFVLTSRDSKFSALNALSLESVLFKDLSSSSVMSLE